MSKLSTLPAVVARQSKRVGRGYGSGKGGHTSTRGSKGQRSRAGGKRPLWFEGGQLPLIKRLPMWRGKGRLKSLSQSETVTLGELDALEVDAISLDTLKLENVIAPRTKTVKIVARGSLNRKVTLQGLSVSQKARQLIEKAGGSVIE